LAQGRVGIFVFLLAFLAVAFIWMDSAKKGKRPKVRRIAALEAIEEAAGRATEMGRPIHMTFGSGELSAPVLAGLQVLSAVAGACARLGTNLYVSVCRSETYPMAQEIMRIAYAQESKLEEYKPDNVRFFSEAQQGYTAGVLELMETQKVAGNFMVGNMLAESITFAETGNRLGAIQLGGGAADAMFLATCDYVLLGDELYAAAADISGDANQMAFLTAEEAGKYLLLGLIVLGSVMTTLGNQALVNLIRR